MFRIFHKPDTKSGKTCRPLADTVQSAPSVEDFRFISPDLMIAGNGYTMEWVNLGQGSRQGKLVLVDVQNEQTRPLELIGYPPDQIFKPHGLDYSEQTKRLYVVNHGKHDSIDVFTVAYPTSFSWCTVTYEMSIPLENVTPAGTANSVVEVLPDEILLTHWLPFGEPSDGMKDPAGIASKLRVMQIYGNVIGGKIIGAPTSIIGRTSVFRCNLVSKKCEPIGNKFLSANGIALSPDKKFVFVVDCMHGDLTAFARNETSGALKHVATQNSLYAGDNIQVHVKPDGSYVIYMGTISDFTCTLIEALVHDNRPCAGGLVSATFDGKHFQFKNELIHDGTLLQSVATAVVWKGEENGPVLLSGPKSSGGILICPRK
jgi:hypothetical protein